MDGFRNGESRSLAIVALDDGAELLPAADSAMALWLERFVEHAIAHSNALVRSFREGTQERRLRRPFRYHELMPRIMLGRGFESRPRYMSTSSLVQAIVTSGAGTVVGAILLRLHKP